MSMFRYRDLGATWFKGNTHIHTSASDGGKTSTEIAHLYHAAGYDFLFQTDHWVGSESGNEESDYPLLWLDGVEIDGHDRNGTYYHIVCLGLPGEVANALAQQRDDFRAAVETAQGYGALIILAHPYWTGHSSGDVLQWQFDGVEVYNHLCQWLNGKGYAGPYWSWSLEHCPNTFALAVDDAHLTPNHPPWNGGWIMVNAPLCTREHILDAIRRGLFYSTQGPEFYSIEQDNTAIIVRTSPVRYLRLVGPASYGARLWRPEDETFCEGYIEIPPQWPYVYLEIEDEQGRRAWTNTLFVTE